MVVTGVRGTMSGFRMLGKKFLAYKSPLGLIKNSFIGSLYAALSGIWDITDTDGVIDEIPGGFNIDSGGSNGWNRNGAYNDQEIVRDYGTSLRFVYDPTVNNTSMIGLTSSQNANFSGFNNLGLELQAASILSARMAVSLSAPQLSNNDDEKTIEIVLRNNGRFIYIDNKLLWVDDISSATPLYAGFSRFLNSVEFSLTGFEVGERFPVVLLSDSFNRSDNTDVGSTDGAGHAEEDGGGSVDWSEENSSTFEIDTNELKSSTLGTGSNSIIVADAGHKEGFASVEVTHAGNNAGIVFRYIDEDNYARAFYNGVNIVLAQVVGGAASNLFSIPVTYVAGATIKVSFTDDEIRVFYNDLYVSRSSSLNAAIDGTKCGLYTRNLNNRFNNFVVYGIS